MPVFDPYTPIFWQRIAVAIICGGIIGVERQLRGKPAGIRTSILICLGTEVFVALGALITADHALTEGRDVFVHGACMGSSRNAGGEALASQGAVIVNTAEDIFAEWLAGGRGTATAFQMNQDRVAAPLQLPRGPSVEKVRKALASLGSRPRDEEETLLELINDEDEVISASGVDEALEKARSEAPDLVTLDIIMPGKTGIKCFEKLRRTPGIRGDIPVIVVTGYQQTEHHQMRPEFLMDVKTVPPPAAFWRMSSTNWSSSVTPTLMTSLVRRGVARMLSI